MPIAALIDTNILIYRFDERSPQKQQAAITILRDGLLADSVVIPHQAIVEFLAVVTRPLRGRIALLTPEEARQEADEFLSDFIVLYPSESLLRTAMRLWARHRLNWYDAHLLAYAEEHGLSEVVSEDFQHDRFYGSVRAVNPFVGA